MSNYYYGDEDFYEEEYGVGGKQKIKKKPKGKSEFKGKGHQSKYNRESRNNEKSNFFDDDGDTDIISTTSQSTKSNRTVIDTVTPTTPPIQKPAEAFRESTPSNNTQSVISPYCQCIKGATIDFERLADIQEIEQEHNGDITYGIKFMFAGKKGLFRIIWYNKNKNARDKAFIEKVEFWHSVPKIDKRSNK